MFDKTQTHFRANDVTFVNSKAVNALGVVKAYKLLDSLEKPLQFEDNFDNIQSHRAVIASLKKGKIDHLSLAALGMPISLVTKSVLVAIEVAEEEHRKTIENETKRFQEEKDLLFKQLNESLQPLIADVERNIPPYQYPLVYVPAGFSAMKYVPGSNEPNFDLEQVKSKKNAQFYRNGYTARTTTIKRIWDQVKNYWGGLADCPRNLTLPSIGGYTSRDVRYYKNDVKVGCQTIERYELEQVALMMGWDFPTGEETK